MLGDVELLLHWDDYFGSTDRAAAEAGDSSLKASSGYGSLYGADKGTTLNQLLVPWIVFWVAVSINSFWGALLSLAVCVLVPLLFYRRKRTIYDVLSLMLTGAFSIASVAGAPACVVVPGAYFAFGAMWSLSCLRPIPLTAYYSMNDYDGEKALDNPIFMRTNKILTAMWGFCIF